MAADCCEGEPYMGDPNGLHTFECPAYQAFCDRVAALQSARPATTDGFDLPGGESTSAALRRVERERDSLARRCAVRFKETEGLRAELASAHTEMDATRTARDNLDRELAHTRRQLGDAIRELMDLGGVDLIAPLQPTEGAPKA